MDKKNIIDQIRLEYTRVMKEKGPSEENIKHTVVLNLALKELGYDVSDPSFEDNVNSGRTDIVLTVNDNVLVIETKRGDETLDYSDISQLADYLSSMGREWGILTNGKEYILLNSNIEKTPSPTNKAYEQSIVLTFDVFKRTNLNYFMYLSKEKLFDTKVTGFYKDIAQYKAYYVRDKKETSWRSIQSTLYTFFDFYSNKTRKYNSKKLEEIRTDDFEEYLEVKNSKPGKKNVGTDSARNTQWSNLSGMLNCLKDNGKISYTPFANKRKEIVENLGVTTKPTANYLTKENTKEIIEYYLKHPNGYRNLSAFCLCGVLGFAKSDLLELTWDNIDLVKKKICYKNRNLQMPVLLYECFAKMKQNVKTDKRKRKKVEYVFLNKFGQPFIEASSKGTLNNIFNLLQNIDENEIWITFTPERVRMWSVLKYWEYGYSIDETMYYTNMNFINIAKELDIDEIYKRVERTRKASSKKLLFDGLFENGIDYFI